MLNYLAGGSILRLAQDVITSLFGGVIMRAGEMGEGMALCDWFQGWKVGKT